MIKYFSTLDAAKSEVMNILADEKKHNISTRSINLDIDNKIVTFYAVEMPDPIVKRYSSVDDYVRDNY